MTHTGATVFPSFFAKPRNPADTVVALQFATDRFGQIQVNAMRIESRRGPGIALEQQGRWYPGESMSQLADRARASIAIFGWTLDESKDESRTERQPICTGSAS
jgi:hypothetical protein